MVSSLLLWREALENIQPLLEGGLQLARHLLADDLLNELDERRVGHEGVVRHGLLHVVGGVDPLESREGRRGGVFRIRCRCG